VVLAVSAGAVAMPLALVLTVAVSDPLNAALAPLDGVVKTTLAPLTGLPLASFTVAWSAVPNVLLTTADCGVPALAVMLAAGPAVLVKLKLAAVASPAALAVRV